MKIVIFQFGLLIGIICCLVFSRLEYSRPRPVAVERGSARNDRTADMEENGTDAESAESATDRPVSAMPNEYSPEAVEKSRAILARLYYEQIAPRRIASSVPANVPSYTEMAQEPAVVQTEQPAPQTVAYVQPTEVIVYPQPVQFVGFARPRRLVNQCRPARHPGTFASNPPRRPDRGTITHLSAPPASESGCPTGFSGVIRRQNVNRSNH
jgi:hypothetical protein